MGFIGATKIGTNPLSQLAGRKHPITFDHLAFAMYPFGFNRVEPGTLRRHQAGPDAHPFSRLLDLPIVRPYPAPHSLALVPGGVIPDQQPVGFALLAQALTTPVQKLGGDGARPYVQ